MTDECSFKPFPTVSNGSASVVHEGKACRAIVNVDGELYAMSESENKTECINNIGMYILSALEDGKEVTIRFEDV